MRTFIRIIALALLSAPAAAVADDVPGQQDREVKTEPTSKNKKQAATKLTNDELQVIAHYHRVNQHEISLAQAAQTNAASDDVKQYAQMLLQDHRMHDDKLRTLAKGAGRQIPAERPASQAEKQEMMETKAAAAKLVQLEGADFDREYLRMMVQDHERELAKIDANMARAKHEPLVTLVRETKPILQAHADRARELQKNEAQARR